MKQEELKVGTVVEVLRDMCYTEYEGLEEWDNQYKEDGFVKNEINKCYMIPAGTRMVYVGEVGGRGFDVFVIGRGRYEFSWVELRDLKNISWR